MPDPTHPSSPPSFDRRRLLAGGAALGIAGLSVAWRDHAEASSGSQPPATAGSASAPRSPLPIRGVNYATGENYSGVTVPELWNPEFVRSDMQAIADQLGATAVLIVGSDRSRLGEAAATAAEAGLTIWLEPRPFDLTADRAVEFMTTIAEDAEQLRRQHGDVVLSLGCEHTIFLSGLVPGNSWDERAAALVNADWTALTHHLNRFLGDAVATTRRVFDGQLTYSAGSWEPVDWAPFDIVGVNLYRNAENAATYVDDLRSYQRHGKPVVITEFGCCSFVGADELGGGGFTIVDYDASVPQIPPGTVRDESVQARYLDDLLDLYETEEIDGAFVWTFIESETYPSPDPRFDFDMAGFAIVTCTDPATDPKAYARTGNWTPKQSFDVIARHFGGTGSDLR